MYAIIGEPIATDNGCPAVIKPRAFDLSSEGNVSPMIVPSIGNTIAPPAVATVTAVEKDITSTITTALT